MKAIACLAAFAVLGSLPIEEYDILIINGDVIDGTGQPGVEFRIAIRGDTIVAMGPDVEGSADRIIDARGLVVSPGFIDMHAHSERALVLDGRAASFVLQGVTTQLLGEQSSAGPIQGKADRRWLSADEERDHQTLPNWTTLGGYFELLEEQGIATNVASFVGSGQVRACVMGYEDRPPTESELEQMKRLVDEAMEQGAVGLSSGLSYVPNIFAETEELIALAKVAADYGGFYGIHLRETGEEPLRGLQEAIRIAREAKIPVEIMHLNSSARENYDEFARTVDQARKYGLDITANVYPYLRGMGGLRGRLPAWAQEGGVEKLLERLRNETMRRRIGRELGGGDPSRWERMMIGSADESVNGKTVAEIASERGVEPAVVVMDVVLEGEGSAYSMTLNNTEENLAKALQLPWVHIGSDGSSITLESFSGTRTHPRSLGTFPRILRKYVREGGALSLEEAVYKMTLHGARRLGLVDRGQIAVGKKADIVIFDAQSASDVATFEDPLHYPTGIHYVLVNGKAVVEEGQHTGAKPGRVLRRSIKGRPGS